MSRVFLPGHQSVFRGEAFAAARLCELTTGEVNLTLDCLGVKKRLLSRGPGKTNNDVLESLQASKHRVTPFWVRSHVSQEQFCTEFGEEHLWRWQANGLADEACKRRASRHFQGAWESRNSKVDALALQVNLFLASRVSFLLSCDKDEGPLVIFPHEHKPKGPKVQLRRRSASQRAADPSRSADRALASFASPPARRVFPNPCFSKGPVDARFNVAPLGCESCPSPAALQEVSENGPIQDAAKAGVQPAQHAPNKKRIIQMRPGLSWASLGSGQCLQ